MADKPQGSFFSTLNELSSGTDATASSLSFGSSNFATSFGSSNLATSSGFGGNDDDDDDDTAAGAATASSGFGSSGFASAGFGSSSLAGFGSSSLSQSQQEVGGDDGEDDDDGDDGDDDDNEVMRGFGGAATPASSAGFAATSFAGFGAGFSHSAAGAEEQEEEEEDDDGDDDDDDDAFDDGEEEQEQGGFASSSFAMGSGGFGGTTTSFAAAPSSFAPAPSSSFAPAPSSTFGAPPASTFGAPPASTFGAPPASSFGVPPASTFGAPPASTFDAPPASNFDAASSFAPVPMDEDDDGGAPIALTSDTESSEDGEIPDPTIGSMSVGLPASTIVPCWGAGGQLFMAGSGEAASRVVELQLNAYAGEMRTLLNGWHSVFHALQPLMADVSLTEQERTRHLCLASRRYRAELDAFLRMRKQTLDDEQQLSQLLRQSQGARGRGSSAPDSDSAALARFRLELEAMSHVLETASLMWHLCEIFFIDHNDNVTAQMVDWLQCSVPLPPTPPDHAAAEQWWGVVYRLVIQGRVSEATRMLSDSSSQHVKELLLQDRELPALLCEFLTNIPSLSSKGWSAEAFKLNFENWRENCERLSQQPAIKSHSHVSRLFEIFLGKEMALVEASAFWHELLIARLLFVAPVGRKGDVQWHADECIKLKHRDGALNPRDECFRRIIQYDSYEALQMMRQTIGMPFFMAHLANLLHHSGHLRPVQLDDSGVVDLVEGFLLEYATEIMTHPSLWQVAASYLAHCPTQGRALLDKLVSMQRLTSDRAALKVLSLCQQHGLDAAERSVCKQMGARAQRAKGFGSAVYWFTRAGDTARVAAICNALLSRYIDNDTQVAIRGGAVQHVNERDEAFLSIDNVADAVAEGMGLCNELAFLVKFRELCVLKFELSAAVEELRSSAASGKGTDNLAMHVRELVRDALEILVRVLVVHVAPRRFWAYLLHQIALLLHRHSKTDIPLLSSTDTYKLMACLEDVVSSHRSDDYLEHFPEQQLNMIRSCLGRNLAMAIVQEASVPFTQQAAPIPRHQLSPVRGPQAISASSYPAYA